MSNVAVTEHVAAPASHVWDLLVDLSGRQRWMSTVESLEVLTDGDFGVGTRWRESHRLGRRQVIEEYEVERCDPQELLVLSSPGRGADYRMSYRLSGEPAGRRSGGTVVTIEQEGHPTGSGGRILEWVLGGLAAQTVEGALRQELADLARVAIASAHPGSALR